MWAFAKTFCVPSSHAILAGLLEASSSSLASSWAPQALAGLDGLFGPEHSQVGNTYMRRA